MKYWSSINSKDLDSLYTSRTVVRNIGPVFQLHRPHGAAISANWKQCNAAYCVKDLVMHANMLWVASVTLNSHELIISSRKTALEIRNITKKHVWNVLANCNI